MHLGLTEIASATGGELVGFEVTVDGVTADSRAVAPGELFVPIVAERDGHDFVAGAVEAGAVAHLTDRVAGVGAPGRVPAVVVADTAAALLDIGRLARSKLPDRVVGITGSVGKTTAKDLLAAVLDRRFATAASARSFNNELGVPLTLANAADGTEAAVIEMGARGAGHIALLCDVARPTIAVVTLVAGAHLEMFGSLDGVATAKGELVESLPPGGTAVLNADDPRVAAMAARTSATVLSYGEHGGDVRAEGVVVGDELHARFTLATPWGTVPVRLGVRGRHNVANALAAAAAGLAAGCDLDDVVAGLATPQLSPLRMELHRAPSGLLVLDDSYNANPTSMRAALESLAGLPAERRHAVLGEMAELGDEAAAAHAEVAAHARGLGIRVVALAAPAYGVDGADTVEDALALLGPVGAGDAVLTKGSRVAGTEAVARALLAP